MTLGTSLIPNHGNQTQKIPPNTSVRERRVKSVAGRYFDLIENKISPVQTKNPCNAESEEFFKEINILLSLNNKTKIATAEQKKTLRWVQYMGFTISDKEVLVKQVKMKYFYNSNHF